MDRATSLAPRKQERLTRIWCDPAGAVANQLLRHAGGGGRICRDG